MLILNKRLYNQRYCVFIVKYPKISITMIFFLMLFAHYCSLVQKFKNCEETIYFINKLLLEYYFISHNGSFVVGCLLKNNAFYRWILYIYIKKMFQNVYFLIYPSFLLFLFRMYPGQLTWLTRSRRDWIFRMEVSIPYNSHYRRGRVGIKVYFIRFLY